MDEIARALWDKKGLPPSWLDERTPHELLFLFGKSGDDEEGTDTDINRVAELVRINRERAAKGLEPVVPSWLLPKPPKPLRDGLTTPGKRT